jgi:hypothetical protein
VPAKNNARASYCSPHFHALAPDAIFPENQKGGIELRRLPKPKLEEIERLVERIARRTLTMLKKKLGEDLRLDALDRLRASTLQQPSFSAMAEPPEDRVGKPSARCEGFSIPRVDSRQQMGYVRGRRDGERVVRLLTVRLNRFRFTSRLDDRGTSSMTCRNSAILVVAALCACAVDGVDYCGKACSEAGGCPDGYRCETSSMTCTRLGDCDSGPSEVNDGGTADARGIMAVRGGIEPVGPLPAGSIRIIRAGLTYPRTRICNGTLCVSGGVAP